MAIDHHTLFRPITKASLALREGRVASVLADAIELALSEPQGPVHVDLPEDVALAAATERAHLPFASHTPARVPMDRAAEAGLDSFEHAETVVSRWGSAPPEVRRRMYEGVAARGAMVTPTLVADRESPMPDALLQATIDDTLGLRDVLDCTLPAQMRRNWVEALRARRLTGAPSADEVARIAAEVRPMRDAGIHMLAGTDMGGVLLVYPGASLHHELELLVRAGLTPMEALVAATREPPRFLRLADSVGTIAPGKIADLVLLDADPLADIGNTRRIRAVVQAGRLLDRARLDVLLGQTACGRTTR
jgi:imidazolonepropionase-like amidohydrolase